MTSQAQKVEAFHRLHAEGCFVIPNPWDVGTAVALEQMGFKALATTSAGHAWSLARPDNGVRRDEALEHLRQIADAVDVPVNADFEHGFARDPDGAAVNVQLAAATGIAGLSIEDSTGDPGEPLYPFELAVERVRAARQAITRAVRASSSPAGRRGSSSGDPISRRRSADCRPTPRPVPTASTRRGSRPPSRSRRLSQRWRRSR